MTNDPGTQPVPTPPSGGASAPAPQPVAAPVLPSETVLRAAPAKPAKSGGRPGAATLVLVVGMIVAIGGIAFAVGRVTAPATAAASGRTGGFAAGGFPTGSFTPGAGGTRGFGGGGALGLTGTVTAVAADHITIQVGGTSGRTVDVPVAGTTTYHTEAAADASVVAVGSEVTVRTARAAGTGQGGTGQGGTGQGGCAGGAGGANPQAGGVPGAGGEAGGFTVGTATDVTVIPSPAP